MNGPNFENEIQQAPISDGVGFRISRLSQMINICGSASHMCALHEFL